MSTQVKKTDPPLSLHGQLLWREFFYTAATGMSASALRASLMAVLFFGAPLIGRFEGVRSGHALNNALLHALFADSTNSRMIS